MTLVEVPTAISLLDQHLGSDITTLCSFQIEPDHGLSAAKLRYSRVEREFACLTTLQQIIVFGGLKDPSRTQGGANDWQ